MGSFDGAETCELIGCYLLSVPTKKYGKNIGLYRDDGLSAFQHTPQGIERIKKDLCKTFRENDLKITIEANVTVVNFLDVTLDLKSGKHWPYSKPGNVPSYVHVKSNHTPIILRNIPEAINKHQQMPLRNIVRRRLLQKSQTPIPRCIEQKWLQLQLKI
jgi:hypothetical protein